MTIPQRKNGCNGKKSEQFPTVAVIWCFDLFLLIGFSIDWFRFSNICTQCWFKVILFQANESAEALRDISMLEETKVVRKKCSEICRQIKNSSLINLFGLFEFERGYFVAVSQLMLSLIVPPHPELDLTKNSIKMQVTFFLFYPIFYWRFDFYCYAM